MSDRFTVNFGPRDPVTAYLAGVKERAEADMEFRDSGSADDVPRLLAAVEAVLARHQPGRNVVTGKTCSRHGNHPYFSITAMEAADVAACPSCTATVYMSCTACGGQMPLDRCPERLAITRALLGGAS